MTQKVPFFSSIEPDSKSPSHRERTPARRAVFVCPFAPACCRDHREVETWSRIVRDWAAFLLRCDGRNFGSTNHWKSQAGAVGAAACHSTVRWVFGSTENSDGKDGEERTGAAYLKESHGGRPEGRPRVDVKVDHQCRNEPAAISVVASSDSVCDRRESLQCCRSACRGKSTNRPGRPVGTEIADTP